MHFTVWEGPAPVLYRSGGAGSCALPCGMGRLRYFTVWEEPAPVLYRVGGAGSCALPCGRNRLRYFTACGGAGSGTLAPVFYRVGGTGSGVEPLGAGGEGGHTAVCPSPPSHTHMYVTVWKAGWGGTWSRSRYSTGWGELAPVIYRVGGVNILSFHRA